MDDISRDELLEQVIQTFGLSLTSAALKRREEQAGMRLTGVRESWSTKFSSVVEFTHELVNPDGTQQTKPDGAPISPISRDYFTKKDRGAVAVLLYDAKADLIAMIQEPRIIGLLFGAGGLMYEFPTGGIQKNETPGEAAHREAEKESGFKPKRILAVQIGSLASAGRIDERMSLFVAEIDSTKIADRIDAIRGEKDEDEYIRTRLITPAKLFELSHIPEAQLNLGTWALATWFEREYKSLKRKWGSDYSIGTKFVHIADKPLRSWSLIP